MKKMMLFSIFTIIMFCICRYGVLYFFPRGPHDYSDSTFLYVSLFWLLCASIFLFVTLKFFVTKRRVLFTVFFTFFFLLVLVFALPKFKPSMGKMIEMPNYGGIEIPYRTKE